MKQETRFPRDQFITFLNMVRDTTLEYPEDAVFVVITDFDKRTCTFGKVGEITD